MFGSDFRKEECKNSWQDISAHQRTQASGTALLLPSAYLDLCIHVDQALPARNRWKALIIGRVFKVLRAWRAVYCRDWDRHSDDDLQMIWGAERLPGIIQV